MNKKRIIKISLWILGIIIAVPIACVLYVFISIEINGPHEDTSLVVAEDGTEFYMYRYESDPFQESEVTITIRLEEDPQAETIYVYSNGLYHINEDYDYEHDIIDHFDEIVEEYHDEEIDGYEFHWGIIYTLDDGQTFAGVPKHEYETTAGQNSDFDVLYQNMVA